MGILRGDHDASDADIIQFNDQTGVVAAADTELMLMIFLGPDLIGAGAGNEESGDAGEATGTSAGAAVIHGIHHIVHNFNIADRTQGHGEMATPGADLLPPGQVDREVLLGDLQFSHNKGSLPRAVAPRGATPTYSMIIFLINHSCMDGRNSL